MVGNSHFSPRTDVQLPPQRQPRRDPLVPLHRQLTNLAVVQVEKACFVRLRNFTILQKEPKKNSVQADKAFVIKQLYKTINMARSQNFTTIIGNK